jgi:hypothetical protein
LGFRASCDPAGDNNHDHHNNHHERAKPYLYHGTCYFNHDDHGSCDNHNSEDDDLSPCNDHFGYRNHDDGEGDYDHGPGDNHDDGEAELLTGSGNHHDIGPFGHHHNGGARHYDDNARAIISGLFRTSVSRSR